MVFYLHFNTSVFSKMLLVTCYFWWGICSIIFRVCGVKHIFPLFSLEFQQNVVSLQTIKSRNMMKNHIIGMIRTVVCQGTPGA